LTWPNWPFCPLIDEMLTTRPNLRSRMPGPDRVDGVEHAGQVGVDHLLPLVGRHLVEHRVAGDAGVGTTTSMGPRSASTCRDAGLAGVVIGDVPLVGLDAGLGGELRRGLVIAGIVGGDGIARVLQRDGNRGADAARAAGDQCDFRP
jgi:hypothetical protein